MKSWKTFKKELLENRAVAKEYQRMKPRYRLISKLIEADALNCFLNRQVACLCQKTLLGERK